MAALSWTTAARIASRELRSSRGKFFFVILSVAIGVAALTGVRGFSSAFRQTLLVRARSILAGDLSARMFQQPDASQIAKLDALKTGGVRMTPITEMAGMATAANSLDPLLVALKAIDTSAYPFYGVVDLKPSMPLTQAVGGDNVAVGEDLLIRLKLHTGDRIQLGDAKLRISSIVLSEPDRLSGSFAAGPRILLTQDQLESTHLLAPGSRAGQRYLFKLPVKNDRDVVRLKAQLETILPESQVTDYRETNPAITMALDRATGVLSLVSLVALVLGAVGVAMAMRTHLLQRMDSIAIMKSLGARSSHILRIYLLQTLLLGLLGGVVGVVLGVGVQLVLPLLLAKLLGVTPELHIAASAIFAGLATGLLTTLLFTMPPLLDIRNVRPILILRRTVDDAGDGSAVSGFLAKIRRSGAQIVAGILILVGITLIATTLSDSKAVGRVFTGGLAAVLLVLLITSTLVLAGLRVLLRGTRSSLTPVVRHGLANLYRPGNPSAALLAAVGLGVMQIASVFFLSHALIKELKLSTQPTLPNVFLIDISPSEIDGVRALLKTQPSVRGEAEMLPVIASRILSVNGTPAADLKLQNFPKRMLQSISITWTDNFPPGTKVVRGAFWQPGEPLAKLAIGQRMAQRLGVDVGSHILFAAPGDPDHPVDATVAAIIKSDGQHAFSRAEFLLPRTPLASLPTVWYGGVHANPDQVGELQRALYAKYPTVTVINVAQAMETLRGVLLQVSLVVQFLAGFSIFAGLVILASAIAGTRYRRIREVVVLKTLGATRSRIAAIFSIEFATLGLIAGFVGLIFANLTTRIVLRQLDLDYHFLTLINVCALLGVALLTVATGWLASFRVLGQKPLEVLREE
ncbi:putative ABC-type transport system involved in lysophospholipase L1 biosynthesis, permease component [Terriglobus roseus DSM 18391]|uniref:Putative ABC-type transport system involved in lysophospholipase L1 biosynthesis, permease component n=1 Tax=Terriglobus roseus (strain DSM 18391 / NRRL B-41598 / KBS 63) TaxID=926566 RepID=I3ZH12_TERRK|nr:FtsX-like permease family protein [Terriglobus roseus]AFL88530.1 putative ABC-type transport system involved in lysophospholipase L1 biosynthesis, permease component [Terriglobus roseus DSM 18391]AFL88870.1 putative ABC-type transport system involved in lysophospholipase L1 biosynthesis, permease component [Terriglobus roseus DSM 18391]